MKFESSTYIPRTYTSCPPNNLAGTWLTLVALDKIKFVITNSSLFHVLKETPK